MRLRELGLLSAACVMFAWPALAQDAEDANTPLFQGMDPQELQILGNADPTVRKATAIVNGDVITDTDVEQRLNLVLAANGGRIPAEERVRLRLQVLRNLIDEKLEIQEAAEHDVRVDDAEIDQALGRVAENFRQTPTQFAAYLKGQGSSVASIRQQIRGEIAWSRVLRRRVEPLVTVGDDEVKAVIDKLKATKGQQQYRVSEIFLSSTPENSARVLADAGRIVAQIRQGASFIAYARQFSEASTAAVGGDVGFVVPGQLSPELQPILAKMTVGSVSDPIPVAGGVTILQLADKKQVLTADAKDAVLSLKQITINFPADINDTKAAELVKTMQDKTQNMGGCGRADEVGRSIGADVVQNDSVKVRDLPPALQTMMQTMQIGQATPPFGSKAEGVRVLVLCGRDDPEVAAGPSFDEVYSQMNDERVNRAARRYLRDLRRDAVIDYR